MKEIKESMVGAVRFELTTLCSQSRLITQRSTGRATRHVGLPQFFPTGSRRACLCPDCVAGVLGGAK